MLEFEAVGRAGDHRGAVLGRRRARLIVHILSVFYGGDAEASEYDEEVRLSLGLLLLTLAEVVELGTVEA